MLGFLDGQTTNPTLIAKNLKAKLDQGGLTGLTEEMALEEYRRIVHHISKVIPQGSVSIQVFADQKTFASEMINQARIRNLWIPNASIKFPCTQAGLTAASVICHEMPVNITLVFSQAQAAAVYEATKNAEFPVFISPFVGRLDDRGECGMDVVANIIEMYKSGDGHVQVLTASVRNLDHLSYALWLKSKIITIPFKVFEQWAGFTFPVPEQRYLYPRNNLSPIEYRYDLTLGKKWDSYDITHELTDKGVTAFYNDWMGLFS
jgi:transaldolase